MYLHAIQMYKNVFARNLHVLIWTQTVATVTAIVTTRDPCRTLPPPPLPPMMMLSSRTRIASVGPALALSLAPINRPWVHPSPPPPPPKPPPPNTVRVTFTLRVRPRITNTLQIHCEYMQNTLQIHCEYMKNTLQIHCEYVQNTLIYVANTCKYVI